MPTPLADLVKVAPFSLVKNLRGDEFVTLCELLDKAVTDNGGKELFGQDANTLSTFREALKTFKADVDRVRGDAYTGEVKALDLKRDKLYTSWREAVRSVFNYPGAESYHGKAAFLQAIVDRLYKGMHNPDYLQETNIIRRLVAAFKAAPAAGYVTDLELNVSHLNELDHANEAFDDAYGERARQHGLNQDPKTKEHREDLYNLLQRVMFIVGSGTVRETYKGRFITVVETFNELVRECKGLLDHRHAANARRKEKEEAAPQSAEASGEEIKAIHETISIDEIDEKPGK
jgi:hypothetical protein